MKRGILYNTARREGYNVLALGQHLDDFAESFVMSAFRNGLLRTMKAGAGGPPPPPPLPIAPLPLPRARRRTT